MKHHKYNFRDGQIQHIPVFITYSVPTCTFSKQIKCKTKNVYPNIFFRIIRKILICDAVYIANNIDLKQHTLV